jgi:acyl carrier protein
MEETTNKVREFIFHKFILINDPALLENDDSLIEKGIIDSTGMLELVAFIGNEFGITVEDDELIPDNLDSIHKVVSFIQRKYQ